MPRIRTQPFVNPRMSARNKPLPELLASTSAGPVAEALTDAELLPSGWGGISHPTSPPPRRHRCRSEAARIAAPSPPGSAPGPRRPTDPHGPRFPSVKNQECEKRPAASPAAIPLPARPTFPCPGAAHRHGGAAVNRRRSQEPRGRTAEQ